MKKQKQHLDLLINAYEQQAKQKGNLTESGINYLKGLKEARRIIFGKEKPSKLS